MPRMSAPDRKGLASHETRFKCLRSPATASRAPRVHQFHGDGPSVVPHGSMHLAEGCCSGVPVVEVAEQPAPAFAQLFSKHRVNRARQHCRCRFLQLRQGNSIRCGDLSRQDEFVDRQELSEFRRACPQLAEHLEHVVCGAGVQFGIYFDSRSTDHPLTRRCDSAAGETERDTRQPRRAHHRPHRNIAGASEPQHRARFVAVVHACPPAQVRHMDRCVRCL